MLKITISSCERGAGFGTLNIAGWSVEAQPAELSLQRNQDQNYLDSDGSWSSTPVLHDLTPMQTGTANELSGTVGPNFIDALLTSPNSVFLGSVKMNDGSRAKAMVKLEGQLLGSSAMGESALLVAAGGGIFNIPEARAAQPPSAAPVEIEEPPQPQVEELAAKDRADAVEDAAHAANIQKDGSAGSDKKKFPFPFLIAAAGAFIIAAGVMSYFFFRKTDVDVDGALEVAAVDDEESASAASAPCSFDGFDAADANGFVQACIASSPGVEALTTFYDAAVADNQCDVARKVMTYFAQNGGNDIALVYAKRFDPAFHAASGCIADANSETAAYWYEGPARAGDTLAMRRLGEILVARGAQDFEYQRGVDYLEKAVADGDNDAKKVLDGLNGG